ncbi:LEF-3 [Chrysodeixis includens nucleopolyhedrovirus]|uniref:LEF-3 n=1 Tax=Chrysodeixis includens nucleopolyhedrovirus TaxID=1207438 RepID=A0A1C8ZZC3_9ABAC|nr:LEF-3 [Chrysodeixis includens nucleopolyhedrovirus]AOL56637.1 LEF-3 [Chrysodeixis includens nucleopolyhedrovirus]AOL56778.1 LEF-3 [Chrysodeixis includens nucleopolyhedrovirus]AOL56920.1 LEF-3 [Chrysodeixis includens nucleopolyhedrovirus]AOL57062.1 LEF-3 [Chrysodeixis includens nucleopolyhedrovirus]
MSLKNLSAASPTYSDEEQEQVYNNTTDVEENVNDFEESVNDDDNNVNDKLLEDQLQLQKQQKQKQLKLKQMQMGQEQKMNNRKRVQNQNDSIEENEEMIGGKRQKIDANRLMKKPNGGNNNDDSMSISSSSTSSNTGPLRQNRVVGELVAKNTLSINNEAFYLFKVLIDNVSKEYYGDASQFYSMKLNKLYNLTITYEKKRYYISDFKESSEPDKKVNVKQSVCQKDFDDNEIISTSAKFQFGFKLMENDLYKMVFVVAFSNDFLSEGKLYQIECSATLQKINTAFKQNFQKESDVIEFFVNCQNKMMNLMRIKCNQSNNNYKSFIIMDITQIEKTKNAKMLIEDNNTIVSCSRQNKRVIVSKITRIQTEQFGNDRLSITFNMFKQLNSDPLKGTFFYGNNRNANSNEDNRLQKLAKIKMDLNQLNDMISDGMAEVDFYIVVDAVPRNYNIIGVTVFEQSERQYFSI